MVNGNCAGAALACAVDMTAATGEHSASAATGAMILRFSELDSIGNSELEVEYLAPGRRPVARRGKAPSLGARTEPRPER